MKYIYVDNGTLNGCGIVKNTTKGFLNYVVSDEIFNDYLLYPNKYIYDGTTIVVNPNYEEQKAKEEKERIAKLYLTAADVERGIYKAKQMDFDDIIALVIEQQPKGLDIKALKIELKANNFYRGNPYVSIIGKLLGFTEKQLDLFFETNDYTKLLEGDK